MTARMGMRMTNIRAYVDTLLADAIHAYYADRRAGVLPFYLYFRTGGLRFAPESPGDEWQLAAPESHRGSLPAEALANSLRPVVERLPILPTEGR